MESYMYLCEEYDGENWIPQFVTMYQHTAQEWKLNGRVSVLNPIEGERYISEIRYLESQDENSI